MPNINDMLKDAQKTLKDYGKGASIVPQALDQATRDLGDYAKAKALLGNSVRSMQSMSRQIEDGLKELNKTLTDLKKSKALIVAQADKNQYDKIEDDYTDTIADAMKCSKGIDDMLKKIAQIG